MNDHLRGSGLFLGVGLKQKAGYSMPGSFAERM